MAKGNRVQVILECTEKPGSSRYVTTKNRRTQTLKFSKDIQRFYIQEEQKPQKRKPKKTKASKDLQRLPETSKNLKNL